MTGLIPQSFIEDLLGRVDLVEIIGREVTLKRAGKNLSARCPFHDERTPSFTVNPARQFYNCFGCGASGDAIKWVMARERLDFPAAVERLARTVGMEVPRPQDQRTDPAAVKRELSALGMLERAAEHYAEQLRDHIHADRAQGYLAACGLSDTTLREFGVGYAPPGGRNLNNIGRPEILEQAGLAINAGTARYRERFIDDVVVPVRDQRGRVAGFCGRHLGDETHDPVMTPDSHIFRKGELLFGLFEARSRVRDLKRLIIVESYLDVLALVQAGIRSAVAPLGGATSSAHLRQAFRYVDDVVLCFRPGQIGRESARRALLQAAPAMEDGRSIRIAFLPTEDSVGEIVRAGGAAAMNDCIQHSARLSDYCIAHWQVAAGPVDATGRGNRLCALAAPTLRLFPDGLYRRLLTSRLAEIAGVPLVDIERQARGEHAAGAIPPPEAARAAWTQAPGVVFGAEARLIRLLLALPEAVVAINDEDLPADGTSEHVDALRIVVRLARQHGADGPAALLARLCATRAGQRVARIAAELPAPAGGVDPCMLAAAEVEQMRRQRDSGGDLQAALSALAARRRVGQGA
ncbi:MAG TPA: DNA primase [Hyphomicrobiales bacterium]|nr:DNA primase [Hyphomicrobiales bacterium]